MRIKRTKKKIFQRKKTSMPFFIRLLAAAIGIYATPRVWQDGDVIIKILCVAIPTAIAVGPTLLRSFNQIFVLVDDNEVDVLSYEWGLDKKLIVS